MQEASALMYQATQFTNFKPEGNNLLSKRTARLKNHLCRLMKSGATPPSLLLALLLLLLPLLLTLQKLVAFDALGVSGCSPLCFFLTFHFEPPFIFPAKILYLISLFCFLQPFKSAISLSMISAYGSNFDKDNGKMSAQNTSS